MVVLSFFHKYVKHVCGDLSMTTNVKADSGVMNAILVSRLSIERCQSYLAHLHAIMHLCDDAMARDELVTESVINIMRTIESELAHSASALGTFD